MLKVAIVGCGKIADAHASQIQRIEGCEIVGVCDREPLMARQLSERFPVKRSFADLTELLTETCPDVVHITTPPASHFDIAQRCLEHGCHVYVEKPLTLNVEDARRLIAFAEKRSLKLTVGHDDQFSHVARRMRELVRTGYLGGLPAHMESTFCIELGTTYARALMADKQHWVRKLPGKLLHNIISHGVARIAEFLSGDSPQVTAHGFSSPLLKSVGEAEIVDELRVMINDGERTTAYFTFSSQMRPVLHEFRIYGPKNGILLDQDHEILIKLRGKKFKSYMDKFVPPVSLAKQQLANLAFNLRTLAARDFHAKAGMKHLIEAFYGSIVQHSPVPIPYREILLTSFIMDRIFEQLGPQQPSEQLSIESRPRVAPAPKELSLTVV
jgi:predicted dehydrogenase